MRNQPVAYRMWTAVLVLLFCLPAVSQTVTGDIGGTVADTTGAVIVGAQVMATNVASNMTSSAVTNKEGIYSIRFLPIGSYKVSVSADGFSTQTFPPFLLEVAQVAQVNVKMKVGNKTDVVTVEANVAPILNTENGMISTTISETLINDLPVNGHNTTELTQVMPGSSVADGNQWNGSVSSPNNSGERVQSFATLPNINGNRTYSTNFTLDGISIVDTGANISNGFGAPGYNIPPEALKEVTILSVVPPAEYGDGATQILSVLKDGSNKYHGSAGVWLQNWEMDANTFGNKRVLPGNAFAPRGHYTQTNYNATFGGPVPFMRNKLFFFADYEAYRLPSAGQSRINVPLNAWRGNTTSSDPADSSVSPLTGYAYFGSAVPQLYDSQNGFAPFNQTIGGILYKNLVPIRNPVAKYIFANTSLLPLPNVAPSAAPIQGNYAANTKKLTRNDQADMKIDWTPTDKDKFFVRWSQGEADDYPSQEVTPVAFQGDNDFPFLQAAMNYTRVFTPAIINEFRAGYTRIAYKSFNLDLSGLFKNGEATVGIPWPNAVSGFSAQNYNQSTNSTGAGSIGTAAAGNVGIDNQFSYGDDLTWQHGRHVGKFGAQLFRSQNNFFLNTGSGLLGSFGYSGSFTGNPGAGQSIGYDYADYLLDYVQSYSVSLQTGDVGTRAYRFAAFAQDDFKLTPTLTLTYGLRWEYDQPMYEVNNKISNINPTTGALQLAGVNGNSRSLYKPTYGDFDPRLGFAWSLSPRLVVRGGVGLSTYMDYNVLGSHHTGNAPFHIGYSGTATAPTSTSSGSPFAVTNGFSTTGSTPSVSFTTWDVLKPLVETQFSFVTEYAITSKQSVALQYVGNTAQHLSDQRNINQETLVATAASAPFDTTVVSTPSGNVTIGTSAVTKFETEAYSNFNAGEATYRVRPSHGFEIAINYTYSKALGDTSGPVAVNDNNVAGGNPQNSYCLRCEYGPSASDSRHMLNSNFVYDLPFGRGKQFGSKMPIWLDEIVGGWKASGTAVLFSGQPNTITANGSSGAVGAGTLRANHYRAMKITGRKDGFYVTQNTASGIATADGPTGTGNTYVIAGAWGTDPSATHSGTVGAGCGLSGVGNGATSDDGICAYGQPSLAVAGTAPIFGTASVGSERAQGFRDLSASVQKSWKLYETHELQFITEAYNVGNITSYNNEGRTTGGGSTWGYVQSTRSQQRQLELELKYKF
jgi:hypothetical protein